MLMMLLRVMMFISYLALLFGYYMKKKHRGSHAYFSEYGNCLFWSSTKWVIDSGALDHMTGNSHIFNNFDMHASSSHVTIADGSISKVLRSRTVNLSPYISLSLMLSLTKFSFNLLSVNRITNNLQCSVKFYPEYCVFNDLKTKKITGRGRKCDGLYVFELEVSKSLVGLSSSSLFEAHCRLGHPSLQKTFQSYMLQHGILHESSCVYRRAQNGVAERKNRHLLEDTQLHCYLVLRDVTFHEDLPYFPVTTYRCQEENDDLLVYVSPAPVETTKQSAELDGPPIKVYDRRPRTTLDLVREPSTLLKDAPIDATNDVSNDVPISAPSKVYGKSDAPGDASRGSDSPPPPPTPELDLPIALRKVPKTVGEALDHSGWCAAMIEEMNALDHNGTWALVDLLIQKKPIGYKWVFSVEMNPDGSICRLNACLVAKGYAHTYGIDYFETLSPVAKISSIRLFISLPATYDWALH
ncbi:retrovirus-related pol polyprotein from transposon TNT 1-94 [Tanacetum coccineum]